MVTKDDFHTISHPHIIAPDEDVHVPRPTEKEALDEIVAEQEGEHVFLELIGRLDYIRDHGLSVMGNDLAAIGTAEWGVWNQFCIRFTEDGLIVVGVAGVLGLPCSFIVLW